MGKISPKWPTYNTYQDIIERGYFNPIVFSAVNRIIRELRTVPFHVYKVNEKKDSSGVNEIAYNHPLEKIFSGSANLDESFADIIEQWVFYLSIAGNAYIEARGPLSGDNVPQQLYILRPDRVKIVPGRNGIRGYVFDPLAAVTHNFNFNAFLQERDKSRLDRFLQKQDIGKKIDELEMKLDVEGMASRTAVFFRRRIGTGDCNICHTKFIHPLKDYYGLSPVEAMGKYIELYNALTTFEKGFIDNNGCPQGIIKHKNRMSEPEQKNLADYFRQLASSSLNFFDPLILEGDSDYQVLTTLTLEQVQAAKADVGQTLEVVFGFPPNLLSTRGGDTFSNRKEARVELFETTMISMLHRLCSELNRWLLPKYKNERGNYKVGFDLSNIMALSSRRDNVFKQNKLAENYLTIDEMRSRLGLPPLPNGEGKIVHIPKNKLPLGTYDINQKPKTNDNDDEKGKEE
jgi:phage portal protein BeeE